MVAVVQSQPRRAEPVPQTDDRARAIARLKLLHAEAEETARLANLLGRSLYAGIALPVLGIVTIGLSNEVNPIRQLVWCTFVAAVSLAMLFAYRHAMRKPFERTALRAFSKDLSAILLLAGFVWGAGAFLALPEGTTAIPAILFAAVPAAAVAYLLRDRGALLLFLAPVAVLAAFGSVLQPFAHGAILAGLILATCGVVAGVAVLVERKTADASKPAMLSLP